MKTWKAILIIWIFSLVIVSLFTLLIKSALNSGFGDSVITEVLDNEFNPEILLDPGSGLKNISSYFFRGLIFLVMIFVPVNAFFTAGLFGRLRNKPERFCTPDFFRDGAGKFWPFLLITLMVTLMIIFLLAVSVLISAIVVSAMENPSEKTGFVAGLSIMVLFFMFLPVLILVADYSRAWQASSDENSGFKALGQGFRNTFSRFWSSYPLVIIFLVLQLLLTWLVTSTIPGMRPTGNTGIFFLFVYSQLIFIVRAFLKAWRYASFTVMFEQIKSMEQLRRSQN